MGLRLCKRSMNTLTVDFGKGEQAVNLGTISVTGTRTIAKVEAAANAWLTSRVDPGQFMQVHIWTLSPLDFSVISTTNAPPAKNWWL